MEKHITDRFTFPTICSGVFRLIKDPAQYRKYRKYLIPDLFFQYNKEEDYSAFRKLISHLNDLYDTGYGDQFSLAWINETLHSRLSDSKDAKHLRNMYPTWRADSKIETGINDDGLFKSFIDYLKCLRIAQMAPEFSNNYQIGKIEPAVKAMQSALIDINDMGRAESSRFDATGLFEKFSKIEINLKSKLYLGNTLLDDHVGGHEAQTLTIFMSTPGTGKTMMSHHLIRQCLEERKYVHLTSVEDREASFQYKLISCLTGIPMNRLKKEFKLLTKTELDSFQKAVNLINTYLRVDFMYGQPIESCHKAVLDRDLEEKNKGGHESEVHILDYTGHIAHLSSGEKGHEKIRRAYGGRKDFALAHNKICFDFAQVNREGDKRRQDDKMLTMSDLAGAYDLAQVGDNIISINRSNTDLTNNTCKLYLCKTRDGRNGSSFLVNIEFDKARYNMGNAIWNNAPNEALDGAINMLGGK